MSASKIAGAVVGPTPGPWSVPHFARPDINCSCGYVLTDRLSGAICTVHASGDGDDWIAHGDNPKFREAVANARLIAAAPLLALLAELTGRYAWEALSENFHHDLTKQRKADLLAAYRAYTGFRDGRLSMGEAWAEVAAIARAEGRDAGNGEK